MLNRDTIINIRERHKHEKRDARTIVYQKLSIFDKFLLGIVIIVPWFITLSIRWAVLLTIFETFIYSFGLFTPYKLIVWIGLMFLLDAFLFLIMHYINYKSKKIAKKLNLHVDLYE